MKKCFRHRKNVAGRMKSVVKRNGKTDLRLGDVPIYNSWSVIHFQDEKELKNYQADTASDTLIDRLI